MDFSNKRILIHYHQNFYIDKNHIFISRNIGVWLEGLAKKFGEVIYLSFSTNKKSLEQDHKITSENISFICLGKERKGFGSLSVKIKAIRYCINYTSKLDYLLIRGFTPLQNIIWFFSKPKMHKAFLLVRELKSKREINLKPLEILNYCFNK